MSLLTKIKEEILLCPRHLQCSWWWYPGTFLKPSWGPSQALTLSGKFEKLCHPEINYLFFSMNSGKYWLENMDFSPTESFRKHLVSLLLSPACAPSFIWRLISHDIIPLLHLGHIQGLTTSLQSFVYSGTEAFWNRKNFNPTSKRLIRKGRVVGRLSRN